MSDVLIGHGGLPYREWEQNAITDFLAGRRAALPTAADFNREFVADADGLMPPIVSIINFITGWPVELPVPIRVHVDDLDRVIAEHQDRFAEQWNAEHPDRPARWEGPR